MAAVASSMVVSSAVTIVPLGTASIVKVHTHRMYYGPHHDYSNVLGRTGTDIHQRAGRDWMDCVAGGESSDSEMEQDDLHDLPDLEESW
jgi:hypothetical protein